MGPEMEQLKFLVLTVMSSKVCLILYLQTEITLYITIVTQQFLKIMIHHFFVFKNYITCRYFSPNNCTYVFNKCVQIKIIFINEGICLRYYTMGSNIANTGLHITCPVYTQTLSFLMRV